MSANFVSRFATVLHVALFLALFSSQPALAGTSSPRARPALYALVVGSGSAKLRSPAKDANDVAAALRLQSGKAFRSVDVRVLTDAEATRDKLLDGLDWISHQTTARDVAIVFLAGQGVNEPRTGRYYFLPVDGDPRAVKRTLLSSADVHDALASITGKTLLLVDGCRPGTIGERKLSCVSDLEWLTRASSAGERPLAVIAATVGGAGEVDDQSSGALARAFVEGLAGAADPLHSGAVTVEMLERHIVGRVRETTHGAQIPSSANIESLGGLTLAQTR